MKFIHCADIHLGSKMSGLPTEKAKIRRAEILDTFVRLCDFAKKNEVTAVIIAGDMFDTQNVPKKIINSVLNAVLKADPVQFLYLAGNHDREIFDGVAELPDNFIILDENVGSIAFGNVLITGVNLNNVNSKVFYERLDLPEDKINIVVMHGQVAGYVNGDEKSEIISIPRLKGRNVDYLALGHYHSYSESAIDVRGKFVYSGCLEGRGFDETGDKGFVLLETDANGVYSSFVKFASRDICECEFNVDGFLDYISLRDSLIEKLTQKYNSKDIVKVTLVGEKEERLDIDEEDLLRKLSNIFFFVKIKDKTSLKIDVEALALDKSLRGEFIRGVLNSDMDNLRKSKVIMCGIKALKGEEY